MYLLFFVRRGIVEESLQQVFRFFEVSTSIAFIADRILAQDEREIKVHERPACHGRRPRRSTPTISEWTSRASFDRGKKEISQLTEIHICTYVCDKSDLHTRMNGYLLSLEIDSLRNVPIVNHSRTRVCKSCAATTSIRTFKRMHNLLIEAFGIINGAW